MQKHFLTIFIKKCLEFFNFALYLFDKSSRYGILIVVKNHRIMLNNRALNILSTLSKTELEEFSRFIISPYFNRSKDIVKIFKFLKPYHPAFKNSKVTSERIYKKIYPGKKFNDGTVRNLFSDFGDILEKFIRFSGYETTFSYDYNFLGEINDRRLDKLFEKYYKKFSYENIIRQDTTGLKDLTTYLLENERKIFLTRRNRNEDFSSQNTSSEALLAFVLKNFFHSYSSNSVFKRDFNIAFDYNITEKFFELANIQGIIDYMKKNNSPYAKELEFEYYLSLAQNSQQGFNIYFARTLELFKQYKNEMPLIKLFGAYTSLINILNVNISADDKHLKRIAFEIKKEMAESGLTSNMSGKLKIVEFANFLDSALMVGEVKWAKDFLEKKISTIEEEERDDIYNYYKAYILFCEKKFEESNSHLGKILYDSPFIRLDVKTLRMRNYYELNYFESAFSQVDSFKQFLKRNKSVSPVKRKSYSNFLKFYSDLLKKKSGAKTDMESLVNELTNCKRVRNKDWLVEKTSEL